MFNQRKVFITGFVLSIICFVTYLLVDEKNQRKIKCMIKRLFVPSSMFYKKHNQELQTNIGNPDPRDERDNNMVWEGSLYSVKYYNEEKE